MSILKLIIFHEKEREREIRYIWKGNRSSLLPSNLLIYQVLTYKKGYYKDFVNSSEIFCLVKINYAFGTLCRLNSQVNDASVFASFECLDSHKIVNKLINHNQAEESSCKERERERIPSFISYFYILLCFLNLCKTSVHRRNVGEKDVMYSRPSIRTTLLSGRKDRLGIRRINSR